MFNSKLDAFFLKKVLIFFIVVTITDLICFNNKFSILAGLSVGCVLSVARFKSLSLGFSVVLHKLNTRKSMYVFILNQVITVIILAVAIKISLLFFAGMVVGVLAVPLIIVVNAITEKIGITRNNFE